VLILISIIGAILTAIDIVIRWLSSNGPGLMTNTGTIAIVLKARLGVLRRELARLVSSIAACGIAEAPEGVEAVPEPAIKLLAEQCLADAMNDPA